MRYEYIITTPSGQIERGTMEATHRDEVAQMLRKRDAFIVSIHPKERKLMSASRSMANSIGWGRVSLLDKIVFARHLANMLRAGLALSEALEIMVDQVSSKKMQAVVRSVGKQVTNGVSLAASLQQYRNIFGNLTVGMVRVGEVSGTLEQNLEYVATVLEKDYELRRKVTGAMIYPVIVLSATVVLGTGMSVFILPKLVRLFSTFRIALPPITQVFLSIATFLVDYGWWVLAGLVAAAVGTRMLVRLSATRPFFHRLNLHLPIVQHIAHSVNLARFSRIMAILLKSGVTINEALTITADVLQNVHYQREVRRAVVGVQQGRSLTAIMADEQYLPRMANRMINVGEKTGRLAETFSYLADFYDGDLDHATKNLSTVVEPLLLIIIGIVLGFLAVAIISPIYQFTGSLSR